MATRSQFYKAEFLLSFTFLKGVARFNGRLTVFSMEMLVSYDIFQFFDLPRYYLSISENPKPI